VEPLNWLNSLLLAYIGQVADWAAAPRWALLEVRIGSWPALLAAYAALFAAGLALRRWLAERAGLRLPTARGVRAAALVAALASLLVAVPWLAPRSSSDAPADGLRVAVLDVGQGDAILLQPAGAEPLLVDAGPVDAAVADRLDDFGVHSLAAAVVTHDQADHAGGVPELLESVPVRRLVFATAGRHLIAAARGAGTIPTQVAEGGELRAGALRLEALWPPRELLESTPDDPNAASLVLLARWHRFEMLLSGDAEAEAVPLDPGPLDVLKVSHHGSADAGLAELLHRTAPRLAVISVGEDNPFGHPDRGVLSTLATQRVPVLRTDRAGTIVINVTRRGMRVGAHP
jgi:competence protein ComEC